MIQFAEEARAYLDSLVRLKGARLFITQEDYGWRAHIQFRVGDQIIGYTERGVSQLDAVAALALYVDHDWWYSLTTRGLLGQPIRFPLPAL